MTSVTPMAKILADRDIKKLLGTIIIDAEESRINPNGIEMRLGKHVHFSGTGEDKEMGPGMFLKVRPGESVLISSLECFKFTKSAIHSVFPGCDLMALITPTTTMMREGIMQAATKVDSGWDGYLNWGLRNSSIKDFILGYGEPIFKLTLFLLEGDEVPEIGYGGRAPDLYQGTEGITRSTRKIPVSIPKSKYVESSIERLDPTKQLQEAGYPFSHIGTELTNLHGKFEVVSKDVLLLKETIATETKTLSDKIDESRKTAIDKVEHLFDEKFLGAVGRIVAIGCGLYGAGVFLQAQGLSSKTLGGLAVVTCFALWYLTSFLTNRKRKD